jgi:hypothetical protein
LDPVAIRKNPRKNAPDVTQKGPINVINAQNTGVRVGKNVFLRVDINPTLTYIYRMKEEVNYEYRRNKKD